MSSTYGEFLKLSIFGQSHGPAIGMTLDGIPAGLPVDMDALQAFLRRRAPGQGAYSTPRKEADLPEFLAGLVESTTCGAPITAIIHNTNTRSGDYSELKDMPRPGHADYPAQIKYKGYQDVAGGGHFSGRLTAPLCIAGGLCKQWLEAMGIRIAAHIKAIGEIGLDYHYEDIPREIQLKAFRAQMALAAELNLPVIVHEREAHADGMAVVDEFPTVKGVFHCYSGSTEMAAELVKRGWYIGFTGVLTFKNARKALEVAASIPLDRLVLETDCPYMAPEPFRGKRNHPGYLYRMAERLAELRGLSVEEIQRITTENGKRLYRIN